MSPDILAKGSKRNRVMTSTAALIKKWKFRPSRRMGQNFLLDPKLAEMIVNRSAISPEDVVLEIGSGMGAMTVPAAGIARQVIAVEKDRRLVPVVRDELQSRGIENTTVIGHDILGVDICALSKERGRDLIVIGNLPYNISSQILVRLIHARGCIRHAVLMFQKELAVRITSPPGGRDYGRLSVMLGYCADVAIISDVRADQFYPKPAVNSTVLKIVFRKLHADRADDEDVLFRVIKAAFGRRRKTLRNSLAGSRLPVEPKQAAELLSMAGIDPSRRAETLSVNEFVRLSNVMGPFLGLADDDGA